MRGWLKNELKWFAFRRGDRFGCLGIGVSALMYLTLRLDLLPAQKDELGAGLVLLLTAVGSWLIQRIGRGHPRDTRNGAAEPSKDGE